MTPDLVCWLTAVAIVSVVAWRLGMPENPPADSVPLRDAENLARCARFREEMGLEDQDGDV